MELGIAGGVIMPAEVSRQSRRRHLLPLRSPPRWRQFPALATGRSRPSLRHDLADDCCCLPPVLIRWIEHVVAIVTSASPVFGMAK